MLFITMYLLFAMFAVIYFDVTRYIIPNWLVGSLLALYPVGVFISPHAVDWQMSLAAMAIVFAAGYFIFAMKWMGGGDIKLLTVCSLWVGFSALLDFIFITAILGGLFSFALLLLRKIIPLSGKNQSALPRILRGGEPIAYGVAIAVAMLFMIWNGKILLPAAS